MSKIKTSQIPNHAKQLYVQLYCEKKGGETNENLHNATQSWLSLSLTKKQHFYDTISTKSAVKKAQRIIKTKPFLRSKFPKVHKQKCTENQEQINIEDATTVSLSASADEELMECDKNCSLFDEENNEGDGDTLPETTAPEAESNNQTKTKERLQFESAPEDESDIVRERSEPQLDEAQILQNSYMNVIDEDTNSSREINANEKTSIFPLTEPVLPIAKTGKDLFELLKARNGIHKPYASLTMKEKRFYGNAVRAIKRDFVKKYKEYLESLSPRQLFDYYMKTFR